MAISYETGMWQRYGDKANDTAFSERGGRSAATDAESAAMGCGYKTVALPRRIIP